MTSLGRRRLLARASFGVDPKGVRLDADDAARAWLESQLSSHGSDVEPLLQPFSRLRFTPREARAYIGVSAGMMSFDEDAKKNRYKKADRILKDIVGARIVRAVHSQHQLFEVMVGFWSNHFSVYGPTNLVAELCADYEERVIRPHALGRFEDLLITVAKSPAMLVYLDNFRSKLARFGRDGRQQDWTGINENYARELLELHTLGIDGGYTEGDVGAAARIFSGWTIRGRDDPDFEFRKRWHDPAATEILGQRVEASGLEQGMDLLRRLARHESTARFVSFKLAQRFVADDPPARLVEAASRVFLATDGDIPSVLREILLAPEMSDPAARKFKTPFRFAISAIRATAGATDGGDRTLWELGRLGGLPYHSRTPDGHGETQADWLSPAGMAARMAFAFELARGHIKGTSIGTEVLGDIALTPSAIGLRGFERAAVAISSPEFQWH